jgi:hypothetical protein
VRVGSSIHVAATKNFPAKQSKLSALRPDKQCCGDGISSSWLIRTAIHRCSLNVGGVVCLLRARGRSIRASSEFLVLWAATAILDSNVHPKWCRVPISPSNQTLPAAQFHRVHANFLRHHNNNNMKSISRCSLLRGSIACMSGRVPEHQ